MKIILIWSTNLLNMQIKATLNAVDIMPKLKGKIKLISFSYMVDFFITMIVVHEARRSKMFNSCVNVIT